MCVCVCVCFQLSARYKSYEKALQAFKEAYRYAQKSRGMEKEMHLESLKRRMDVIERFVQARHVISEDPEYVLLSTLSLSYSLALYSVNEVRRPGRMRKKRPNDGKMLVTAKE